MLKSVFDHGVPLPRLWLKMQSSCKAQGTMIQVYEAEAISITRLPERGEGEILVRWMGCRLTKFPLNDSCWLA